MIIIRDGLELFREIVSDDLRPLMKLLFDEYKLLREAVMEQVRFHFHCIVLVYHL